MKKAKVEKKKVKRSRKKKKNGEEKGRRTDRGTGGEISLNQHIHVLDRKLLGEEGKFMKEKWGSGGPLQKDPILLGNAVTSREKEYAMKTVSVAERGEL